METDRIDIDLFLMTFGRLLVVFAAVALVSLFIGAVSRRKRGGEGRRRDGLWLRMLTFAVLAPLTLVPAFLGGWPLASLVALFMVLCSMELWGLSDDGLPGIGIAGIVVSLALPAAAAVVGSPAAALPPIALGLAALGRAAVSRAFPRRPIAAIRLAAASAIAGYAGLLTFLILIREGPSGAGGLVFTLLVVEIADVGAMLGGLLFGKTPLAPRLSPGKTAEGFASGVLVAMGVGLLFRSALPTLSVGEVLVDSSLLAACGLLGDLLASALKRRAGRKDFGRILPGHGGFMDRADSMLVAGPAAWLLLSAGPSAPLALRAASKFAVAVWAGIALIAIALLAGPRGGGAAEGTRNGGGF